MNHGSPSASVVLCVLDGAATIDAQLRALLEQDGAGAFEVVVVDNGSSDGTRAIVEDWAHQDERVRLIDEPRRGLNVARNTGVAHARSDKIAFCDADDEVQPGWLAAMTESLKDHAYVGGAIVRAGCNTPSEQRRWGLEHASPSVRVNWRLGTPSPIGACCAFHRQMWLEVDGFDERLRVALDELEFFSRGAARGWTMVEQPRAIVHYRLAGSGLTAAKRGYRYGLATARTLTAIQPGLQKPTSSPPGALTRLSVAKRRAVEVLRLIKPLTLGLIRRRGYAAGSWRLGLLAGHAIGRWRGPIPGPRLGYSSRRANR